MKNTLLAIALLLGSFTASAQVPQSNPQNGYQPGFVQPPPINTPQGGLDNSRTYQNTYGQTVHSPANQYGGGVPSGASAQCSDGTYSFSQSRQGTCSGHSGVAMWLK